MNRLLPRSPRSVITEATELPESRRIHDEVEEAARRFEESHAKLKLLTVSLKEQHSSMLEMNERRLKTAKQFEILLADTPLSKLVSEIDSAGAKSKVFSPSPPVTPQMAHKSAGSSTPPPQGLEVKEDEGARRSESAALEVTDENEESKEEAETGTENPDENEESKNEAETGTENTDAATSFEQKEEESTPSYFTEDTSPKDRKDKAHCDSDVKSLKTEKERAAEDDHEIEGQPKPAAVESDEDIAKRLAEEWAKEAEEWVDPSESEEGKEDEVVNAESRSDSSVESSEAPTNQVLRANKEPVRSKQKRSLFRSLVVDGSDFENVHSSYIAVNEAAHKLTLMYSDQYSSNIINYVEEWDKVVSSRVHGRLMEFNRLKSNLDHYVQKVDGLRAGMKKRENRNRLVRPKASQRFDRNELKLGGAREGYDSYSESLLLLLEEVTERAWRDCLPLLMRAMQFDANFSADQARVFSALNETVGKLEVLGTGREVDPEGRLRSLKDSKPEEIYTGGKHVVCPVHSTQEVYEV